MKKKLIKDLSLAENEFLSKLHKIVEETIKEEDLVLNNLLHPAKEQLTSGQQISDKVARFGGSWKFIIFFTILLSLWIIYNVTAINSRAFDPYPFILMNLILSCIAAFQAPIIMMSQNRKEEKDRMRSENDYLINLKAEMGIRSLHQKMDLLLGEQIKKLYDLQAIEIELLNDIKEKHALKSEKS
ncbi:DUF1003 domain-containing protein [Pedobacter ginsengisoli]|uniref:DUF1003 domain-containing protein n=1 Tax=Pedobacter ginsengisoli TaxID=363852 RepID=UPI0025519DDB|nr:DUF1003 domain-containing protein [Pedobacter ginsengisoli]